MYNVACGGQAQYLASAPTALFEGSTNARSARIHTRDDGRNIAAHTDTVSTDIIQTTKIPSRWQEAAMNSISTAIQSLNYMLVRHAIQDLRFSLVASNHVCHTDTHDVRVGDLQGRSASPAVPPQASVEIVDNKLLREE